MASLLVAARVASAQAADPAGGVAAASDCADFPDGATGFTVASVTAGSVALTWSAVPPPPNCSVTYTLYRSTDPIFLGSTVVRHLSDTMFTDAGLEPATKYYYQLETDTEYGFAAQWPTLTATTLAEDIVCSAIPPTPTGLAATARSSSQIDLSWSGVTAPPGCSLNYALFRDTTRDFTPGWGNLIAPGLTATSHADSGLAPSTTYYYVVQSYDSAGKSGDSAIASATTAQAPITCTAAPSAVTVTATPISSSRIDVSWTASPPPPGCSVSYAVYMSTSSDLSGATQLASGLTSTSYTAGGLAPLTTYHFSVRASDAAGSTDATPASAMTPDVPCSAVPPAPAGLTATARSPRQIDLSWAAVTPPSGCPAVTYAVYQGTTAGFTPSDANRVATNLPSPSYSSAGLTASTTYYFVVRANDGAGSSPSSSQASATTAADITCGAVPSAPLGVTATALSPSQINLTWGAVTPPTGCSALTYAVYQSTDPNFTTADANRVATNLPTPSFSSTGLSPSTTYFFIVRAVDAVGASPGSVRANATTRAATPSCTAAPTAPSVTATSFSASQINLSWSPVSSPPGCAAVSYAVYQGTDAAFTPSDANRAAVNLSTTGYSATGLSPSTTYHFVVRAMNAAGASPDSSKASATTQASAATCTAAPAAPSVTATPLSGSQINLSWSAVSTPPGCSAVSYAVYQGTDASFTPSDANRAAINLTTPGYSATGLMPATTYYFVVRAFDSAGASPDSSKASATTRGDAGCASAPAAPAGIVATARSSNGIDLSWSAVTPPAGCTVTYSVYQGTDGNFTPSDANRVATGLTSPGYTAAALSASTTYAFVVRAVDAAGSSPDSARGFATTSSGNGNTGGATMGSGCSAFGSASDAAGILLALATFAARARARRAGRGSPQAITAAR